MSEESKNNKCSLEGYEKITEEMVEEEMKKINGDIPINRDIINLITKAINEIYKEKNGEN